jgi:nucleoside-diphosphate-sugar epimerase
MRAMQRLLIIGCGDVMRRALPWLTAHHRVYATVRSPEDASELRRHDVVPILADLDKPESLRRLAGIAQLVVHSAPPPSEGLRDTRTRQLLAVLESGGILPRRFIYISTTGVYGDCEGARIDETRRPQPGSGRGRRRLDAEQTLRRWGARAGVQVSIVRAPGIYAADRLPTARIVRGEPVLRPEDDVQTNHIHAEDLAQVVSRTLYRGRPNRVYNACDDTELAMGEWFDRVADTFGMPHPPRVSRADAASRLSPMTLSFMGESRRIGNQRLKRELGYRLIFPTVDAGLAAARLDSSPSTLDS